MRARDRSVGGRRCGFPDGVGERATCRQYLAIGIERICKKVRE